jgi:hypothetical protein
MRYHTKWVISSAMRYTYGNSDRPSGRQHQITLCLLSNKHLSLSPARCGRKNQGCQTVHIFSDQKSPFWVNFGGPCNGWCWFILGPFSLFNGHLVYFTYGNLVYLLVIWYTFPRVGKLWKEESGNPGKNENLFLVVHNPFRLQSLFPPWCTSEATTVSCNTKFTSYNIIPIF